MTDYTDLIARLRLSQTGGIHYEAADALEAQARRIAELEKMLAVHRLAVDVDALKARIAVETHANPSLGPFLKKARQDMRMSLREVEEATGKEISNAYLSQLESGKVTKPSPHVLYALSTALGVAYETLMERAGYIVPASSRVDGEKHGRAATFSIDNLSAEEETELLDYLTYIRSKRK
jgi:transcriptional regulator with XRE-family HTH domain